MFPVLEMKWVVNLLHSEWILCDFSDKICDKTLTLIKMLAVFELGFSAAIFIDLFPQCDSMAKSIIHSGI